MKSVADGLNSLLIQCVYVEVLVTKAIFNLSGRKPHWEHPPTEAYYVG